MNADPYCKMLTDRDDSTCHTENETNIWSDYYDYYYIINTESIVPPVKLYTCFRKWLLWLLFSWHVKCTTIIEETIEIFLRIIAFSTRHVPCSIGETIENHNVLLKISGLSFISILLLRLESKVYPVKLCICVWWWLLRLYFAIKM